MALEFKLPDIGEGTVEGEIVRWLVKPGDEVKADGPVVEVMTDKATVVLTAPRAGKIKEIRAEAGKVAKVGSVIYVLDTDGADAPAKAAPAKKSEAAPKAAAKAEPKAGKEAPDPAESQADEKEMAPEAEEATPEGEEAEAGQERAVAAKRTAVGAPASGEARAPVPAAKSADAGNGSSTAKPLAAPATRKLARELGVDLASVGGTGTHGRVTDDDVRRAAAGPAPKPRFDAFDPTRAAGEPARAAAPVTGAEDVERLPFRGIRKAIAAAMTRSKFTATHYTYVEEVDMTEVVRFREREKARAEKDGVKLTFLPFVIKAVIAGLKKFPMLNSELDEKAQEIIVKKYYHIGLSVQTDAGLMVPVLKHADRRSGYDLAREIDRLVSAARSGKASPQDLKGSTFTITSAGNIGGVFATPIINFPEVAILGVNQIKKRAVVMTSDDGEDEIQIRHMIFLSISLDHRVVDGAIAAHFMNEVKANLEEPMRLVMGG